MKFEAFILNACAFLWHQEEYWYTHRYVWPEEDFFRFWQPEKEYWYSTCFYDSKKSINFLQHY